MNVAVIGYGLEGKSTCQYFLARGDRVTVCDQNLSVANQVPSGVSTSLGDKYLDGLDQFDKVIRTAGLKPALITDKYPALAGKISTNINEFLAKCPTENIIGITGTKGKGTTATLIARILESAGKEVFLGGNIGVPPLSFIKDIQPDNWVILELSSFQLIDIQHSPYIAVCLMVVPEHLDWHKDSEEYYNAKANLFNLQGPNDIAIYYADSILSHRVVSNSPGCKTTYYASPGAYEDNGEIVIDNQVVCQTDQLKLRGAHNWQNVCAAITVAWQAGISDIAAIKEAVTEFSGLDHRLDFVAEVSGVEFYDDSFGTTPETAIVAIEAFEQPKVLILGGSSKGASFKGLARSVAENNVRQVITIGETGPAIAQALRDEGFTELTPGGTTMEDTVLAAQMAAEAGDVVLLSTGCASFDLFEDYKDRGQQFKAIVNRLKLNA